jgi:hypothetical protein
MKLVKASLLLLLGSALLSIAPVRFSPDDGLVAYYSFNNCDARDDSGNGSHGQLFGSVSCWCGIEDDGLLLDGVNDYIEFAGKVNRYFSTSDFTLSFYVKAERYMVFNQSLISKRSNCEEYGILDILLDMNGRQILPKLHETPNKFYPNLSTSMDSTSWFHFAVVREGTHALTYVNGELMQKGFRCSGVDISNDALLSFSNSPCVKSGNARRFKGVLDELRVYNRALSPEEIRTLYQWYPVENANMDCVT